MTEPPLTIEWVLARIRCPSNCCLYPATTSRSTSSRGVYAAGPPSPKAAAHRPIVCGSRPRACAVPQAVHPWASSQMACHRSRSRGVGARISRRCKSLASIRHCSRNRSISLTPITNPSLTPRLTSPVPPQIYPTLLRISPWLWFRSSRPTGGQSTRTPNQAVPTSSSAVPIHAGRPGR